SSGLAEAGMIEDIKHFRAHLQAHRLVELDVLEQGEIHVTKAGADNHIASEIAEARDRSKGGGIEPAIHTTENYNRPRDIWPHRVCHSIDLAVRGDDVNRIAALRLNYGGKLPALFHAVASEWQLVNRARDEAVTRVEVRQSAITSQVVAVLHGDGRWWRTERIIIYGLGPGIGSVELQAVREAFRG